MRIVSILVEEPGLLTTVQDLGRQGYRQYGIPLAGAMDQQAAATANIMLGNEPGFGVIECTLVGPVLTFSIATQICLAGGDMNARLSGYPVSLGRVIQVQAGETLKLGTAIRGCRTYIAVKGGIQVEPVLDSLSTFLKGGIGGYQGRALSQGDILDIKKSQFILDEVTTDWGICNELLEYPSGICPVRYVEGTHYHWFDNKSINDFQQYDYTVNPASDRMGYRLQGVALRRSNNRELVSEGVTVGTIQVPPEGLPLVLMSDCQTTGGYPRLGHVITVDIPRLAQLKPGDKIRFSPVTLTQAQSLFIQQMRSLERLAIAADYKWKEKAFD